MTARALLEIDDDAVDEYTRGQCHALALAIHERTDLPLAGIWRDCDDPDEDTPYHVVVMLPEDGDNNLLDIEGPHAGDRWKGEVRELEVGQVLDLHLRDYRAPDMGNARRYAQAVLKQYGIKAFKPKRRTK